MDANTSSSSPTSIYTWIAIAVMTSIVIAIVVAFIIIVKRMDTKIKQNQDAISTVVVQDEANLVNMGLNLESDLNKEIGAISTSTIQEVKKANTAVAALQTTMQDNTAKTGMALQRNNTDITNLAAANTASIASQQRQNTQMSQNITQVMQEQGSMLTGTKSFDRLSVGPATISRDTKGGLQIDAGKIFTVTSSNMNLNTSSINIGSAYILAEDKQGNLDLTGPGQLVLTNGLGFGSAGWGIDQTNSGGPLRMFAPASNMSSFISLGFQQGKNNFNDTLVVKSKAATATGTADQVTVTGDLVVTGSMTAPYLAALQAQLTTLSNQTASATGMAKLAYDLAQQQQQQNRVMQEKP